MIKKSILKPEVIEKIQSFLVDKIVIEEGKTTFLVDCPIELDEYDMIYAEGRINSAFKYSGGFDSPPETSGGFSVYFDLIQIAYNQNEPVDLDPSEWNYSDTF